MYNFLYNVLHFIVTTKNMKQKCSLFVAPEEVEGNAGIHTTSAGIIGGSEVAMKSDNFA